MDPYCGTFVIVGGGIAGVSCAEQLSVLVPNERIILITSSSLVKAVNKVESLTATLEDFKVVETEADLWQCKFHNLLVIKATAIGINSKKHLANKLEVFYKKLCVCSGGFAKVSHDSPYLITIRDTASVHIFQERLKNVKKIVIVGNGGIATELIYSLQNVDKVWAIKDKHIVHKFLDASAAKFLQNKLGSHPETSDKNIVKWCKYVVSEETNTESRGTALGPNWQQDLFLCGSAEGHCKLEIETECQLQNVLSPDQALGVGVPSNEKNQWPVFAHLTNEKLIGCDLILCAIGVQPDASCFKCSCPELQLADDGGILVDDGMRTSVVDIYAAGDVCTAGWLLAPHWFQVKNYHLVFITTYLLDAPVDSSKTNGALCSQSYGSGS